MTQDDIHAKGLNSEPAKKYPKIKGSDQHKQLTEIFWDVIYGFWGLKIRYVTFEGIITWRQYHVTSQTNFCSRIKS